MDYKNYFNIIKDDFKKTPYFEKYYQKLLADIEENKNKPQYKIFTAKTNGNLEKYNFKGDFFTIKDIYLNQIYTDFLGGNFFKIKLKFDNLHKEDLPKRRLKFFVDRNKAEKIYNTVHSRKGNKTYVMVRFIYSVQSYKIIKNTVLKRTKYNFYGMMVELTVHVEKVQILTKIDGKEKLLYSFDYPQKMNGENHVK